MSEPVHFNIRCEECGTSVAGSGEPPWTCPTCGATYPLEVSSPAPFIPNIPTYQELSVPESLKSTAEAVTVTPAPAPSFKVPLALKALAAVLVPLLAVAAVFVPFPFGPLCAVLALVAAGFLGISIPLPKFLAGRALVGPTLAPLFATLATALGKLAFMQPEGTRAFYLLYAAAGTCALLAGVAVPLKS